MTFWTGPSVKVSTVELPDRTWTRLQVTLPGEVSWLVTVHLDDELRLDDNQVPTAVVEDLEIPF